MGKKSDTPSDDDFKWALDRMFDTDQWGFGRRDRGIVGRQEKETHADKAKKSKPKGPRKK